MFFCAIKERITHSYIIELLPLSFTWKGPCPPPIGRWPTALLVGWCPRPQWKVRLQGFHAPENRGGNSVQEEEEEEEEEEGGQRAIKEVI